VVATAVIYMSTFYADSLSEALQDELEKEDTMMITKFVWLMQKKTTVGIHRFEDLIHKEFQELVEMGCARHATNSPPPCAACPHARLTPHTTLCAFTCAWSLLPRADLKLKPTESPKGASPMS
tara:strand:+ start:165 stop:533 length:369 start_codon:yes stop_codon:yes gene_type:complete